jgi:acyl dehydratase
MALDPNAAGFCPDPERIVYTWRDAALYALAVGAGTRELDLLVERPGFKVLPGFLTALAFNASGTLLRRVGGAEDRAMFGEQSVHLAENVRIPPGGTLTLQGRIQGIYALGPLGIADLGFTVTDDAGNQIATVSFQVYYDGEAPPNAPRPPRTARVLTPSRDPDWRVVMPTRPEQALLYRLCGDLNPLHADPEAAARLSQVTEGRPILHGLCTTGFVSRAVINACCAGDSDGLLGLSARFSRPVWPGDTLIIEGWGTDAACLRVRTLERPDDDVLTAARAWIRIPTPRSPDAS